MSRQIVVYVQVNMRCDMLHEDPAIAVDIGVRAHMLMVMLIMIHCHI